MSRNCRDCKYSSVQFNVQPCAGCFGTNGQPYPKQNFVRVVPREFHTVADVLDVHEFIENDIVYIAGARHKVAKRYAWFWLHRDAPEHNLQVFLDVGMTIADAGKYMQDIDNSIVPDRSWPYTSASVLHKIVLHMLLDQKFMRVPEVVVMPVVEHVTKEEVMPRTITNSMELYNAGGLRKDDIVMLFGMAYIVTPSHLHNKEGSNERVFEILGIDNDKYTFAECMYGYFDCSDCAWPCCHTGDYAALTRMVHALYGMIAAQVMYTEQKREKLAELRLMLESYQQDEDDAWETAQKANSSWEYEKQQRVQLEADIKALESECM